MEMEVGGQVGVGDVISRTRNNCTARSDPGKPRGGGGGIQRRASFLPPARTLELKPQKTTLAIKHKP